ncbi:transmembrane 64-like [Micractinium conductrix]|uniref:Transmembrane 64-like n=1 Tax=Micractinium conductrix TaxID=554055 RepID=A0A2P6VK41_9CHLO|nr:transmembrane 64-like [Micractinium conductrix]|eukprot:PSC74471.1 transmembrane 64-like [Micractinium conductrix]
MKNGAATSSVDKSSSPEPADGAVPGDVRQHSSHCLSVATVNSKLVASLGVVGGLTVLVAGGVLFREQISAFVNYFITLVDDLGPLGYAAFAVIYFLLEVLAFPALPITMAAGAIFGAVPGTVVVSVAATAASTAAFLIARYAARDRVLQYAAANPKFAAIDKAIGIHGFKVVVLLRLSPLLPLAASNYLYGLTSVDTASYVLGSWLGMLPGTFAYVAAGAAGQQLLQSGSGLDAPQWWQVGAALGISGVTLGYVGKLATKAVADVEKETAEEVAAEAADRAAADAAADATTGGQE